MSRLELTETVGAARGSGRMNRRNFLKGTAVAGGSAVALSSPMYGAPRYSPVGRAEAIAPIVLGAVVLGAAALGYLVGSVTTHYIGDYGSLTGTEESADLHLELNTRFAETYAADDTILTMVNNRILDSYAVAWHKAKVAAISALNGAKTEADAKLDVEAAIQDYYTVLQENLLNRFDEVAISLRNQMDLEEADATLSQIRYYSEDEEGDVFAWSTPDIHLQDESVTLLDGTVSTHKIWNIDGPSQQDFLYNGTYNMTSYTPGKFGPTTTVLRNPEPSHIEIQSYSGSTPRIGYDLRTWRNTYIALMDAETQMQSNGSVYTTNLYQNFVTGDLSLTDVIDPTTLAVELSTDYKTTGVHAFAAAEAAVLGIPGDTEHAMVVELVDSGITVDATLWTDWEPEGVGNPFVVGTMYDPPDSGGAPVFISYEYDGDAYIEGADVFVKQSDGTWYSDENVTYDNTTFHNTTATEGSANVVQTDFVQVTEPFIIKSATNLSTGESVSTVGLEDKNPQTADVALSAAELAEIAALREALLSFEAPAGGAAGGFDFSQFAIGSIPGAAVVLGIGGAAALALGRGR